jgi:hypothetical protein
MEEVRLRLLRIVGYRLLLVRCLDAKVPSLTDVIGVVGLCCAKSREEREEVEEVAVCEEVE